MTRKLFFILFNRLFHRMELIKSRIKEALKHYPLISVLVPVYNTEPDILRQAIESVINQTYQKWELCLVDDASDQAHVRQILEGYSVRDSRILVRYSKINQGISASINQAAAMASGAYIGVLDHDDELAPDALCEFVRVIREFPVADLIYCDEDKIDESGRYCEPWHKSGWNPDMSLSFNYVMHFALYRRRVFQAVKGVRRSYEGSQDYDLLLRVSELTGHIYHIPKILYHWRKGEKSIASGPEAKPGVFISGLAALNDALNRRGIDGFAEDAPNAWKGVYRVIRTVRRLKCSVIILSNGSAENLRRLLDSISAHLSRLEIQIIICSDSALTQKDILSLSPSDVLVVFCNPTMTTPSRLNTGAQQASGDALLFLDDTMELVSTESMTGLMEHVQRNEVGAVGGKVYYSNRLLEHAGIILGPFGLMGYSHRATGNDPGYAGLKVMISNFSAVMGLGMMTRKQVFLDAGGFDEAYRSCYWDADYCLQLRNKHFLITFTPYAEFIHHIPVKTIPEMISEPDASRFKSRWQPIIDQDPYFNPNFSRQWECFYVG